MRNKPTPSSDERKSISKDANQLEVAFPFFPQDSQKKAYSQALKRLLDKNRLFQGRSEVAWKGVDSPDASILHVPRTNLGLITINSVAAAHNYGRQELLLPLENLFPNYQNDFVDLGWRKGVVGEHLFSVPQHISIRMLFYRRDLLDQYFFKAPKTWDELEKQAKTILAGEKNESLKGFLFNFNPPVRFTVFLDHVWSQGAELYENGPNWKLNHKALETALLQMERFFKNDLTPMTVMNSDYTSTYQDFLEGRAVFIHHWSDGIRMIQELPESERQKFGYCPVPSSSLSVQGKSTVGGLNYAIPKNTRYPEAAAQALQTIMQENFQTWYAEKLSAPFPGLKSIYLNEDLHQTNPYLDQTEFILRHGKLLEECPYFQGDYLDWLTIGGQELTFFLKGAATLSETVNRMEERFSNLLPRFLHSRLTTQTIEYIQNHLETSLKVNSIAQHLKVSPEHLIRVFKENTRQTPLQYINESKMDRAKILLKKSHLTVGEIAYRLGYKSRDHFSRLFHELVKRTPRDYRN